MWTTTNSEVLRVHGQITCHFQCPFFLLSYCSSSFSSLSSSPYHSLVRMTVWYRDWSVYQSKGIQLLFHVHTKMLTTREEHSYRNLSPQSQVVRGVTLIQVVALVILSCLFCCHVASTGRCPCSPPPYFHWRGSGGGRLVMIEPYPNLFCSNLQVFNFGPCRLMRECSMCIFLIYLAGHPACKQWYSNEHSICNS